MESETQKRRVFEIIAKFVAEHSKVTINFEPDKVCADVKNRIITLPSNVKTENIYPALAWVMHEAAHINHTVFDEKKIIDDQSEFEILNAIEDTRIDNMNFQIMPNVQGIYEEMVKFIVQRRKENPSKGPKSIEAMVMCDAIMLMEGFHRYTSKNQSIIDFINRNGLIDRMRMVSSNLHHLESGIKGRQSEQYLDGYYKDAKKLIKEIRKILLLAKNQLPQPQQPGQGQGAPGGQSNGNNNNQNGAGNADLDLSGSNQVSGGGVSADVFKTLAGSTTNPSALGTASLLERTRSDFKELLNVKERHVVDDGTRLSTDNLTAFYTGDIDELFVDDTHVKRKKSKLLLILDASGSMTEPAIGFGVKSDIKYKTLISTIRTVVDILEEVRMLDGLDVDYDVCRFDNDYYKMDKDKWEKQFTEGLGGGTNLLNAFKQAQDALLKDYSIEGKRIILFVTDGEVGDDQLNQVRDCIMRHNSDVRCLVIGIGAAINGPFVKKVSGHNILTKDYADVVLAEAIMELL